MKVAGLAWRQLRRDLAAGEIRILLAALILGVMAVSAVGFLTDRAGRALALEANRLLGGDAVLKADAPLSPDTYRLADVPGLAHTETRAFPSMIGVGAQLRLGDVRALGPGFPLRGRFLIQDGGGEHVAAAIPARGTVWMSTSGMQSLGAHLGDAVMIGATKLRLAARVVEEPDAALDYFSAGPKLFLNLGDLPATGLEQEGSRITYRIVVAGTPKAVDTFVRRARASLGRGQKLETAADARPEIRSALDRASRFLGLAALVSVVLSAIAVAMAARRHSARHLSGSAVMRCLGASQRTLAGIYLGELLLLGLAGSAAGVLLAYGLQAAIGAWLAQEVGVVIPPAGWMPVLEGFGVGLTVLLAFGAPPVLALRRVPALRVLRRDLDVAEPSAWVVGALGLGGLGLLLWWKAGSPTLATAMLVGLVGTFAALSVLALALILVVKRLRARLRGPWRYGLANVSRRVGSSVAQIASLGLGLMVLLLLTFVRTDLLSRWRDALPADAPNRFIVNVQPEQVAPVLAHLRAAGVAAPTLVPMVRARLVEVNGKRVTGADYAAQGRQAQRFAEREFNLSQAATLRADNQVSAGRFWPATGPRTPEFSVEAEFAAALGWHVGDRIAFDVAGQRLEAPITSQRKVDWESFKPNFFVLASPGVLDDYPASHIGGVHVAKDAAGEFTRSLVTAFPNLTVVDLDAIMAQVRSTMDQVSKVVQAVFWFSVAAGLLVLFASVSASQDERLLEGAVMRVLGGNRRQLLLAQASEFAAIGVLAGLTAAIAATVLAGVVAKEVLDLPWHPDWRLAAVASVAGTIAAVGAGLLATRRVLAAPPSVTLRALQD
jgi:putative ABC transport system permease protein